MPSSGKRKRPRESPVEAPSRIEKKKRKFFQHAGASPATSKQASSDTLQKLFNKYRDAPDDNPDIIGVEGSMKYINDLKVDLEDIAVLAIGEALQAPSMGEFTREGFINGWKTLNADTISKQQTAIANLRKTISTDHDLFRRVYRHTFQLARQQPSQKSIPLDVAIEYWRLLFSANQGVAWDTATTPWLDWWLAYLQERWKKAVNRDMWNMTYEFFKRTIEDEDFGWWDEQGAWPGVLDEFVSYVREKRDRGKEETMMDVE